MAARFLGVEFVGKSKKHAVPGINTIRIHGHNLKKNSTGQTVKVKNMVSTVPGATWSEYGPADDQPNFVRFDAKLTLPSPAPTKLPTTNDTGDLTITLEYSSEPDLEITCEDVEHGP